MPRQDRYPVGRRGVGRRGAIVVLAAFLLVIFMMFAAFAVDVGFLMLQRTRAQAATDAASLAGVAEIGTSTDTDTIEATVDKLLTANGFNPDTDEGLQRTVTLGIWEEESRAFVPVQNPSQANALRVELLCTRAESFFGRIFGANQYRVPAQATATRGISARDIVLVIDCSTSMWSRMGNGNTRLENARAAAQDLVEQLGERDRVGLAIYSWRDPQRKGYERTGIVERLLDLDKEPASSRIAQLTPGEYVSGTNIGGGFRAGLDVFLNSSERTDLPQDEEVDRILVMLTDGQVNMAEPYPEPDDGESGVLPPPPYKKRKYSSREAVRQWANAIRARGILVHVITLGPRAHDQLMVEAASVSKNGEPYYHHVGDSSDDADQLLQIYRSIGRGDIQPRLVQ